MIFQNITNIMLSIRYGVLSYVLLILSFVLIFAILKLMITFFKDR